MSANIENARNDLVRYLNGDITVPRVDDDSKPAFVDALWDDSAFPGWPIAWPVKDYADNRINPVTDVPFGSYAWWVRKMQRTVDSAVAWLEGEQ